MTMRFVVLASGSAGNSSFLQVGDFGLLIDAGLGPRQLGSRLTSAGLHWSRVGAVLLTHTHTDHWQERTLAYLAEHRIPLYCHPEHVRHLQLLSQSFDDLVSHSLVRDYQVGVAFEPARQLSCLPFHLPHDSTMTCGFRIEGRADLFGRPAVLAYAADLGCWDASLARVLANADVLALEFNHDVVLQRTSGRSRRTIARNLGDRGHLSNEQAAVLVREVLRVSDRVYPKHLIQLHLSRDCNRPNLAVSAVRDILIAAGSAVQLHTARQDQAGPILTLGSTSEPAQPGDDNHRVKPVRRIKRASIFVQPLLPGWDESEMMNDE
jgi:phosphoribosyl 1,2-cyclic phosphodiesterase